MCERWFCDKHLKPTLAFIKDFNTIQDSPEIRALYMTEVQNENVGHPDFEYSRRKFTELDIEQKRRNELIEEALDRMNAHWNTKGYIRTGLTKTHYVCPKCGNRYDVYDPIEYCYKCGVPLKEKPKRLSDREVEEFLKTVAPQQTSTVSDNTVNKKEVVTSEGDFHFKKTTIEDTEKTKKTLPVKKIFAVCMIALILGLFLWYSPSILSMIQGHSNDSSYSQITVSITNSTSLQFGGIDYFFQMGFTQQYLGVGHLSMWDSLVESKSYNITEGSIYRDFGIEIKVKEVHVDYAVLLVKPTVQNYLAESGFTKLIIAEGQAQDVSFSGNNYTIMYSQAHLYVGTPLLQIRDYTLTIIPMRIHSDLGLEIRVSSIAIGHVIVFVKPSY